MGMKTDLDRVRVALKHACRLATDDCPQDDMAGLWNAGVTAVALRMSELLDVGEYQDPDERDVMQAAQKFCFDLCSYGNSEEPGKHTACRLCTLRPFTIDRLLSVGAESEKEHESGHKPNADSNG